jgi:hypothetical protein
VVKNGVTDDEVKSILNAQKYILEEVSLVQHHDAITGTAKQHVSNDYSIRLYEA